MSITARPLDPWARSGLLLVSSTAIHAIPMLSAPLGAISLSSFWTRDFLTIDTTPTFRNYIEAVNEPLFMQLLRRPVLIAGTVTLVTVLLALPIAYFVSSHVKPETKALWIFLTTIPFWTSYLIRVFLWRAILGFDGVVNTSLMRLGVINEPLAFILHNPTSVVFTLAHAVAPFAILPIFACNRSTIIAFFRTGKEPTLPVHVWGLFRVPQRVPVVMALGTILVAASICLLITAEHFRSRGIARAGKKV